MAAFEKATERPEDLGLSIAEGKAMLAAIQAQTVLAQAATWSQRRRCCPACGERRRSSKGSYPLVFRTLYGDVGLDSPRLHRIVAALDGGYVRNWDDRTSNFELIVGRSMPEDRPPRYLGLVHGYDQKPKRRKRQPKAAYQV